MKDLIGFFDSGLGGISVLHEAHRIMPNENYIFFGDNKNAPYGPRPLEEIRALTAAGIQRLLDREVKALVIACNTATSAYAEIVREQHPELPIVGMEPALKPAHYARHGGQVIVLATEATLRLEKFRRLMARYGAESAPVEAIAFYMTAKPNRFVKTNKELVNKQLHSVFGIHLSQFPEGCGDAKSISLYTQIRSIDFGLRSFKGRAEGFRVLGRVHMHCLPEAGK